MESFFLAETLKVWQLVVLGYSLPQYLYLLFNSTSTVLSNVVFNTEAHFYDIDSIPQRSGRRPLLQRLS